MASRPAFFICSGKVCSREYNFEWSGGFAISQKRKNINKLHSSIGGKCLEISTKSEVPLGQKFSAFNLRFDGHLLENIFQSSKLFEAGGPYVDLLNVSPKDAKRDTRLKESGKLIGFAYDDIIWPLEPKTVFYDYIYYKAVGKTISCNELHDLIGYDYFTDIEFNPNKSINTQAKAIAIVKLIYKSVGYLPELSRDEFFEFHRAYVNC